MQFGQPPYETFSNFDPFVSGCAWSQVEPSIQTSSDQRDLTILKKKASAFGGLIIRSQTQVPEPYLSSR